MTDKKPAVFNYEYYEKAMANLERIEKANRAMENQLIQSRIRIADLEEENKRLKEQNELMQKEGITVTGLIDFVKNSMCKICTNKADCDARLDNNDDYPCPLDLL